MKSLKPRKYKKLLTTAAVAIVWIAIWQVFSLIINQPLYVPSPYATLVSLGTIIVTQHFWMSVLATFLRVAEGIVISFILGCSIAYVSAHAKPVETFLSPFVTAVKSTPIMSIIIVALVWFQASFVPVFSCILLCFPIFYANTLFGIKSIEPGYLELAKVYHVKRIRVVREIMMPSVMPHVYAAISICIGFSWKAVVAAEVLSIPKYSMGYSLFETKLYLNTSELFAWTIAIIIISIIVERVLKKMLPQKGKAI